jgi:hypothetical protein
MDGPLSSPTAPPTRELLLRSALLSVYLGLRVATAALSIAGTRPASGNRSFRARE